MASLTPPSTRASRVRGKPHAWDPSALLAAGRALLSYIFKTVSSHPSTRSAELAPGEEQFDSWPVFRVKFDPAQAARGGPAVEIRLLDAGEVKDEVLGGKKDEERVGFLLKRWVSEVRRRRARVVEREEETR